MTLTAARLVVAQRDGLSELAHVWQAVDACLDHSARWTLERAAARGLKFLVQHLALSLSPAQLEQQGSALVMDFAAGNGHLDILTWLHATTRLNRCSTRAMDDAAKNGHLRIVQWLHQHRAEGCTTKAMDYAAGSGHLDVVQWLAAHRREGCTTRAMDLAAQGGHLAVLQWLQTHRSEGCTASALNYAAAEGHVDVARWLCDARQEHCSDVALLHAARNGHMYMLEFLGLRFPALLESVGAQMVHAAIANGQPAVLSWLIAALPMKALKCDQAAGSWMDVAAEYGQVAILRWFHTHATALPMGVDGQLPACTAAAVEKAARNGHDAVLTFLYENELVRLSDEAAAMQALVAAVQGGHRVCVQWLVAHFRQLYAPRGADCTAAMDAAAAVGHADILQFLRDEPTTRAWQPSAKAVNEAARQGSVDVLRWLHFDARTMSLEAHEAEAAALRWTPAALELAATNGHLPAVQWLTEHHRQACSSGEAFNAAAYMDHLDVVQFLYADVRAACDVEQALEHAQEGGAEDTLAWLEQLI